MSRYQRPRLTRSRSRSKSRSTSRSWQSENQHEAHNMAGTGIENGPRTSMTQFKALERDLKDDTVRRKLVRTFSFCGVMGGGGGRKSRGGCKMTYF